MKNLVAVLLLLSIIGCTSEKDKEDKHYYFSLEEALANKEKVDYLQIINIQGLTELPESIGNLTNLQVLSLDNNLPEIEKERIKTIAP